MMNVKFPVKCLACPAEHPGGLEKAVSEGWNIVVLTIKEKGNIQLAGCPDHTDKFISEVRTYIEPDLTEC